MVIDIPEIRLHLGDGLTTSLEISNRISGAFRPLFFLDGHHEYESVRRELEGVLKAFPNPVILVHDTFYQPKGSSYNIGPFKAIEDVLARRNNTLSRIDTRTGLPGMTLLYRKMQVSTVQHQEERLIKA